jgi:hypothetical protein
VNNKRRNRIFVIAGIMLLSLTFYFKPFSRTEIIILDHLTEMNDDSVENQILLVKNPPYFSSTLEKKIEKFNEANPVKGKYFRRLFIKEHDKVWFPNLGLQENVDYELKKITRYDLDNIDFLATSNFSLTVDSSIYRNTKCKIGKLWYYKY